jgi:hypothetical protein
MQTNEDVLLGPPDTRSPDVKEAVRKMVEEFMTYPNTTRQIDNGDKP